MNKWFYLVSTVFLLSACSSKETCTECEMEKNTQDSIVKKDSISLETALKQNMDIVETKDQKANHEKIVKKFGEQWDFCTCVVANDSINKAFEKNVSDKQADKLMKRWEHVELKCKEFLTQPNTTPEERAIHEKRVQRCLRNK